MTALNKNNEKSNHLKSFNSLALNPTILNNIQQQGYTAPMPIQAKAIPIILDGKDLMAAAQTGTGKTAAFTLPMLELLSKRPKAKPNHIKALVLTPTRELAAQVAENIDTYGKGLHMGYSVVYGGVSINPQMMRLRKGVDILVATPGRLLDLHQQNAVHFSQLEFLVLDEADRMLDMGFIHDLKRIIKLIPTKRQTLMFSATFSSEIKSLAKEYMHKPLEVAVTPENTTVERIEQHIYTVDKARKTDALITLIQTQLIRPCLVFCRTKHGANKVAEHLNKSGINAAAIHGNKSQGARTKALADFKSGAIDVLVATDIAARGIDIDALPFVINLDLPNVPEDYVHRIGRTGRAGCAGKAFSFVAADEVEQLSDIENLIGQLIPREELLGYEPTHIVPATILGRKVRAKTKALPEQKKRSSAPRFDQRPKVKAKPSSRLVRKPQQGK